MILSAQTIRLRCRTIEKMEPMISPFHERTRQDGMTFGLSPAGYDVRVEFDDKEREYSHRVLSPGKFMLASTIERFVMPIDVLASVADKFSWARRGLAVQNTIIEPGWSGWLTLELTNHGEQDIRIERGMPIAQIIFHELDRPTEQPYSGKYQDQKRGPVAAIHDKTELSIASAEGKVGVRKHV